MNNDLEAILDLCLTEIKEGKADIDDCLTRYPGHAQELQPLLRAATKLSRAKEVMPDPAYRARARTQLSVYMQQHPQRRRISPIFWRFAISLATVFLMFLASGTAFAQGAVPGDALYSWKLTSENVWRLTSSDQLNFDLAISNRRVHEIVSVSGDSTLRARAIENYEKLLVKFTNEQDLKKRERIRPVLTAQREALGKAGILVPELEAYFPH